MSDKLEEVVDIGDFQVNIAIILESKGVLSQFKNEDIPAPKKSVAVNEVKVKNDKKKEQTNESKEALDQLNKDWNKSKIPVAEDNANKAEIEKTALKFIDDPTNASIKVTDQEEVAKLISAKKIRVCWSCWSVNCYKKQIASMHLKLKKKYLGKCTGAPTTFKDLKSRQPNLLAATA